MDMTSYLKWAGSSAGIVGAFIVAANIGLSGWGFVVFLLGSLSWVIAGFKMEEPSIWLLNMAFTTANLLGIWRWLIA
jgi:hypothetical protein